MSLDGSFLLQAVEVQTVERLALLRGRRVSCMATSHGHFIMCSSALQQKLHILSQSPFGPWISTSPQQAGPPAVLSFVSLRKCRSQFFIINLFPCLFINTPLVQFLWRTLTSTSVRPRGKSNYSHQFGNGLQAS